MENHKVTTVDIEAATGDVYLPTVEAVKPSRSWTWTIVCAVVLISLCAVAALCFAWHFPVSCIRSLSYTAERFKSEIRQKGQRVKVSIRHVSQIKSQGEPLMAMQTSTSPGKKLEMIHQNTYNNIAKYFSSTRARKINKVSLSVLDVSSQHEMLSQIAKSTKAAIHLRGKW